MKKLVLSLVILVLLVAGSVSAWAASKNTQFFWTGLGVNVTTVDGKKNATKKLFKELAFNATVSGDWVYFLKVNNDDEYIEGNFYSLFHKGSIYRMKKDGTELTQLTKSHRVGSFFIDGNSIYYDADDYNMINHIYVMSLDGKGAKISAKNFSNFNIFNYSISKGIVYYIDREDRKLYTMKVNGTGKKALSSGAVGQLAVLGDTIFYSDKQTDYKVMNSYLVDKTGKNKVKLPTTSIVSSVALLNQWFYFEKITINAKGGTESRTLEKIKRDGKRQAKVADLPEGDRFVGTLDNTFVYTTAEGKVYQVTTDGKIIKPAQ